MKSKLIILGTICLVIGATVLIANYFCGAIDSVNETSISVHEILTPEHLAGHKMFLQGRVLANKGDYPAAIAAFTRSHELVNNEILADRHQLAGKVVEMPLIGAQFEALAFCFYKQHKYTEAEKEIGWAIACKPDYAPFYQARALVYDRLNRPEPATADRKKAAELKTITRAPEPRNFTPMFVDEIRLTEPQ